MEWENTELPLFFFFLLVPKAINASVFASSCLKRSAQVSHPDCLEVINANIFQRFLQCGSKKYALYTIFKTWLWTWRQQDTGGGAAMVVVVLFNWTIMSVSGKPIFYDSFD